MQRSQTETIGLVLNGEALVVRFFPNSIGSPLTALSDFEHGFVIAAALAARLGDPNPAAKMLGNAGFQALDCSELNAVDKQQLQLVNQQPGMKLNGLGKHN